MKRILFILLCALIEAIQISASTTNRIIYLENLRNLEIKQNSSWFGKYTFGENPRIPEGREIPPISYTENKYDTELWEDGIQIPWGDYYVSFCKLITSTTTAVLMEYNFCHYFVLVYDKTGKMIDYKTIGMSDQENYALINVQTDTLISVDQYSISPYSHYNRLWGMEFTQSTNTYSITKCGIIKETKNIREENLIAYQRQINWDKYQFPELLQLFTHTTPERLSSDFLNSGLNSIDYPYVWKYIDATVLGDPYGYSWWAGKITRINNFWLCSISKEHTIVGMPQYNETYLVTYTLNGEIIDNKPVVRFGDCIYDAKISYIPSSLCFDVIQYYNTHNEISHIQYFIKNNGQITIHRL